MDIKSILVSASDETLANKIIESFQEIEKNYQLKLWKTSELDAGHFVEAVRRFLELKLFSTYTPIGTSLPNFNEQTIRSYQNGTGDESYRIHIPKALWLIYGIRNKRGIGHISAIKANQVDANLIVQTSKWILSELIRINGTISLENTERIIDKITEKTIDGVWSEGEIKRVLIEGLSIKQQVIILLYNFQTLSDLELYNIVENGNYSYLKSSLKTLHKDRIIEYKPDGFCILTPKGIVSAEKIIIK